MSKENRIHRISTTSSLIYQIFSIDQLTIMTHESRIHPEIWRNITVLHIKCQLAKKNMSILKFLPEACLNSSRKPQTGKWQQL